MKRFIFAGALAAQLVIASPPPAMGADDDAARIVEEIQRSFDGTRAMTARFTQTVETKGFGQIEKHTGRMSMLKPNMMKWDYDAPAGKTLTVDGERLWFHDPEENVVYFEELTGFLSPRSPALFLAGEARLDELFTIDLVRAGKDDKIDDVKLKLVPKKPAAGLAAMLITLDGGTYDIRGLLMVDHLGNKNRIEFSEVDRTARVDRPMFVFHPPAGAPVRAMTGAGQGR